MIIGNTSEFAIESQITQAYERLSFRALGFFVIYVGGRCYGRRSADSTMLACSYDEVERRIANRGAHIAPFASNPDAGKIARAFRDALYGEMPQPSYFGIPLGKFRDTLHSNRIMWAPDGDQAFDDGSYVLQFDLQNRVRLIAFKSTLGSENAPQALTEIFLSDERFYGVLKEWHDSFETEWVHIPKSPL